MAQKDYIDSGKPKAKPKAKAAAKTKGAAKAKPKTKAKPRASKAAPAPQPAAFPVIPAVVVGLVLCGFGYFLWFINGAAEDPTLIASPPQASQPEPAPRKAPVSSQAIAEQPDVPTAPQEEDWDYIEALKHKTVPVPLSEIKKKGPFLMQCATFKDGRRAEAFKAQLALLNFESRIRVSKGSSVTWHRVQLGPFETNRDAQRARHQLSKHKINGCKIWNWS
ncbi:MAG: cell division protein FtsN [Phenylobacterium sp.]|jgi:cell division protein FtsN